MLTIKDSQGKVKIVIDDDGNELIPDKNGKLVVRGSEEKVNEEGPGK